MNDYTYQEDLQRVWQRAEKLYRDGHREASEYFAGEELAIVERIGATPQEIFDFAEDYVTSGEPDFLTFALVADIRRSYFLIHQQGKRSTHIVQDADLPPKDEAVDGIPWLPRIIVKAKAKLKGEMNPNLMYGCGGDRRFFKEHHLHPAEFLRLVADHPDDDRAIIEYVTAKSLAAQDA